MYIFEACREREQTASRLQAIRRQNCMNSCQGFILTILLFAGLPFVPRSFTCHHFARTPPEWEEGRIMRRAYGNNPNLLWQSIPSVPRCLIQAELFNSKVYVVCVCLGVWLSVLCHAELWLDFILLGRHLLSLWYETLEVPLSVEPWFFRGSVKKKKRGG